MKEIKEKQTVRIFNLKARPDLNGKFGHTVKWLKDKGRWNVLLYDGSSLALQPKNLLSFKNTRLITPNLKNESGAVWTTYFGQKRRKFLDDLDPIRVFAYENKLYELTCGFSMKHIPKPNLDRYIEFTGDSSTTKHVTSIVGSVQIYFTRLFDDSSDGEFRGIALDTAYFKIGTEYLEQECKSLQDITQIIREFANFDFRLYMAFADTEDIRSPPPNERVIIKPGTLVRLVHLKKKNEVHLNGAVAKVMSFSKEKGEWNIEYKESRSLMTLCLPSSKLRVMPDDGVDRNPRILPSVRLGIWDTPCPLCGEKLILKTIDMEAGESVDFASLKCSHSFHKSCLSFYAISNSDCSCPDCHACFYDQGSSKLGFSGLICDGTGGLIDEKQELPIDITRSHRQKQNGCSCCNHDDEDDDFNIPDLEDVDQASWSASQKSKSSSKNRPSSSSSSSAPKPTSSSSSNNSGQRANASSSTTTSKPSADPSSTTTSKPSADPSTDDEMPVLESDSD